MNIDKFTITSYDAFTGFDRSDGGLILVMDELSDMTISQAQETQDITGKGGMVVSRMKKNKSVTGSGTNGFLSGGALATMLGTEVETGGSYSIRYTDTITVTSNTGTTAKTATGTAGMEIGTIYVRDSDQMYISGGTKLTQVAETPATGEFTYDPDTNTITFYAGDVADGTEVIAFYWTAVNGAHITNDAEKYSKVLDAYLDCTCQDACDNVFHGQFHFPRADFSGEFDIAGGSDPATQGFEFTTLPDRCTGKTVLWDFYVFD